MKYLPSSWYVHAVLFLCLLYSCKSEDDSQYAPINESVLETILDRQVGKMANYLTELPVDSMAIPRSITAEGDLDAKGSRQWTSGFFPGVLWQLFDYSENDKIKRSAETWSSFVEKEKWDTHTHDLGFKLNCSFGKAYEITGNEEYKEVVIQASETLIKRYNPGIGAIRSWDWNADVWQHPVIIDNMMNLEMLFEATQYTGDSIFHKVAESHAMTTLQNHFRSDNSSYHVVDFDTLTFQARAKVTHQGFSSESAWSRGQAWGLYGFTEAYQYTKNPLFLEQAEKIAAFYLDHPRLPEDGIPYWDFDAPNMPEEPRDVSAACVAASGLLKLAEFIPEQEQTYMMYVDKVIQTLNTNEYQSNRLPFLLEHSTGSVPGEFEIDVPIIYADYYYLEFLLRRLDKLKGLSLIK